jgi:hypothetical protein
VRRQLILWILACMTFASGVAKADAADAGDDTSVSNYSNIFQGFETQVGVEMPMQIGIRVRSLLPHDFFSVTGVGYSPAVMGDAVGNFSNALGMTASSTAKVLGQAMHNAFYLDLRAGYKVRTSGKRFFDGMYIDVGYSLLVGSGGNVGINDIANTTGGIYLGLPVTANADVKSTIHDMTVHAGYTWSGIGRIILTGEVGLIKPLASINRITPNQMDPINSNLVTNDLSNKMDTTYKSQLFIPTIGLWASYLF